MYQQCAPGPKIINLYEKTSLKNPKPEKNLNRNIKARYSCRSGGNSRYLSPISPRIEQEKDVMTNDCMNPNSISRMGPLIVLNIESDKQDPRLNDGRYFFYHKQHAPRKTLLKFGKFGNKLEYGPITPKIDILMKKKVKDWKRMTLDHDLQKHQVPVSFMNDEWNPLLSIPHEGGKTHHYPLDKLIQEPLRQTQAISPLENLD